MDMCVNSDDRKEHVVETSRQEMIRNEGDYCEVTEVIITKRIIVRKIPRVSADGSAGASQKEKDARKAASGDTSEIFLAAAARGQNLEVHACDQLATQLQPRQLQQHQTHGVQTLGGVRVVTSAANNTSGWDAAAANHLGGVDSVCMCECINIYLCV